MGGLVKLRLFYETMIRFARSPPKKGINFILRFCIHQQNEQSMRLTCRIFSGVLCLLFCLFATADLSAQSGNKIFKGLVVGLKGEPIPGASVVVKGTTNGTTTDANGAFSIEAQEGATVTVTNVGFASQEFTLKGTGVQSISLSETAQNLEQIDQLTKSNLTEKGISGSFKIGPFLNTTWQQRS